MIPNRLVEPINGASELKPPGDFNLSLSPLSVISLIWAAGAVLLFAGQISAFIIYKIKIKKRGRRLSDGLAHDIFMTLRGELNCIGGSA